MQALIKPITAIERRGELIEFKGLQLIASGPPQTFIGEICEVLDAQNECVMQAEVIGFSKGTVTLMPLSHHPVRLGYTLVATGSKRTLKLGESLQGRIVNAFACPIDARDSLNCTHSVLLREEKSINPLSREPITQKFHTNLSVIDGILPLGKGQRIGIFAGSGVGKSSLLAQLACNIASDVQVIAMIGERGREVNDFICQHLDEATLQKSIIVVACSDESALIRRQAVYTAITIAEFFCDEGKDVLLLMDSITRFAMAQREIGLMQGEFPTARGYTPSVFARMPSLIERAGNFKDKGSITAIYTVLVEGDDFNEPISDAMRSLLDGHIVLTRELAEKGHYPAIDVLQSISRLTLQLLTLDEQKITCALRALLSCYQEHKSLVELGAYKPGTNESLDFALQRIELIHQIFQQKETFSTQDALFARFKEILT